MVVKDGNSSRAYAASGSGNPAGNASNVAYKGNNGTGGMLVISSNKIINKCYIYSKGSNGGNSIYSGGGSSGGGTVNIFYKDNIIRDGNISATGGISVKRGGAGGAGCITIGNISSGTFVSE